MISKNINALIEKYPVVNDIANLKETFWQNDNVLPFDVAIKNCQLQESDVKDASDRLQRFASYFKRVFPETKITGGLLESPLKMIPKMKSVLESRYNAKIDGDLWIKLDSHLAVSGSIKARGGIYEVLCVAEDIAIKHGGLKLTDDYAILDEDKFKNLFSKYSIAVGSTGNLGLSIGIISAKLGFKVTVHMSADAREWKKQMLREKGVNVIEYKSDYSVAVENGRKQAKGDEFCHFIDDENSKSLFLGYAVSAERLKKQFDEQGVVISKENPLHVYLPCGVGGGPGGVAFGLKLIFKDNVNCYFAEPTHSACMMLGMATGLHNAISVNDLGVDNKTIADGLAVGRASGFVGKVMEPFMSGCYSLADERMSSLLATLWEEEDIRLEPSALAGVYGPVVLSKNFGNAPKGVHLAWATGGSMVPEQEIIKYYEVGVENRRKW